MAASPSAVMAIRASAVVRSSSVDVVPVSLPLAAVAVSDTGRLGQAVAFVGSRSLRLPSLRALRN